jgi:O-antigen/teichoic acid export membrane protein
MYKKVVSHSLIYGLGPFIPKIINLLMLPIFTSFLTAEDYGIQTVLNSGLGLISVFAFLGLQLPIMNVFYQHPNHYKKRWSQFYGFLNLWMIIYTCLLSITMYFIIPDEVNNNRWWIILLSIIPIVCCGTSATIGQCYFQYTQQPKQVVLRTVITSFLTICLNYITIVILDLHYMGWIISNCISSVFLNVSYWYPLRYKFNLKPIYKFKRYVISRGLSLSLPMIPHYYSTFLLGSVDGLILKFFAFSTFQIGYYGFAGSFGGLMAIAVGALNTAVSPLLYDLIRENKYEQIKKMIWVIQSLLMVLVVIVCIWMKEIFSFMVNNKDLETSYFLATVFIMAHMYRPMYFGVTSILFYKEKTKNLWKITFGAGVLCVVCNVIFLPIFGFQIPAYVLFISYLMMGYGTFLLKDYKSVKIVDFKPGFFLFFTLVSFIVVYFFIDLNYWYKIIFTTTVIMTLAYFYRFKSQFFILN